MLKEICLGTARCLKVVGAICVFVLLATLVSFCAPLQRSTGKPVLPTMVVAAIRGDVCATGCRWVTVSLGTRRACRQGADRDVDVALAPEPGAGRAHCRSMGAAAFSLSALHIPNSGCGKDGAMTWYFSMFTSRWVCHIGWRRSLNFKITLLHNTLASCLILDIKQIKFST